MPAGEEKFFRLKTGVAQDLLRFVGFLRRDDAVGIAMGKQDGKRRALFQYRLYIRRQVCTAGDQPCRLNMPGQGIAPRHGNPLAESEQKDAPERHRPLLRSHGNHLIHISKEILYRLITLKACQPGKAHGSGRHFDVKRIRRLRCEYGNPLGFEGLEHVQKTLTGLPVAMQGEQQGVSLCRRTRVVNTMLNNQPLPAILFVVVSFHISFERAQLHDLCTAFKFIDHGDFIDDRQDIFDLLYVGDDENLPELCLQAIERIEDQALPLSVL